MAYPTREEYEEALKRKVYVNDILYREYQRKEKLLDEICDIQEYIKSYKELRSNLDETIHKYEIYQELIRKREIEKDIL